MKCCRCKRDLPEEMFYQSDKYRCKECHRKQKKESYDKYHPQVYMNDDGRLMKRSKGHPVIFWNGNMISDLKRHFPTTSNAELVELLGFSERTILRKAKELGLHKSKDYIAKAAKQNSIMGVIARKKKRYDNPDNE